MTASDVLEPIDYFFDINKMGPPQFHTPSVQHISSTQKGYSFSAHKIPLFHTKDPSVPHVKPFGSPPKTPQFQPPQFHTKNPSVPLPPQFNTKKALNSRPKSLSSTHPSVHTKTPSIQQTPQTKTVLNWGVFGVVQFSTKAINSLFRLWSSQGPLASVRVKSLKLIQQKWGKLG